METKRKTYRSEGRYEADRPLMEAQGWQVRSVGPPGSQEPANLEPSLPALLDRLERRQGFDVYVSTGGRFSSADPANLGTAAGCLRVLALPVILIAWPFASAWRRWQARPRWDVLYERAAPR
jgi:hypothetical protein